MKRIHISKFSSLLFLSLVFLFSTSKIFAEDSAKSFFVRPWAVGQSVTYQTKTYKDGNLVNTETTTYSIVGLEYLNGNNYLWVEIEQDKDGGVTVIEKLQMRQPAQTDFQNTLVTDFHFWSPRRRIQEIDLPGPFKRSSINEYELPAKIVEQAEQDPFTWRMKKLSAQFSAMPEENIRVAAGDFAAYQFHEGLLLKKAKSEKGNNSIDVWGAPEIPILGLVKKTIHSTGSDGESYSQETELVSYKETGAYSKIKGKVPIVSLAQQEKIKAMNLRN